MKWLVLVAAVPVLLIGGGLAANRPPMLSPPGLKERLKAYLTTNVAETRSDHPFSELRPLRLAVPPGPAGNAVLATMRSLGWQEILASGDEIRAVAVSPLFRFRDDVEVRLEAAEDGTLLQARSASRVGKGDLAANTRHLLDLFAGVQEALP